MSLFLAAHNDIGKSFHKRTARNYESGIMNISHARSRFSQLFHLRRARLEQSAETIIASARERLTRPIVDDDDDDDDMEQRVVPGLRGDYYGWSANLLIEPVLARFPAWSGCARVTHLVHYEHYVSMTRDFHNAQLFNI